MAAVKFFEKNRRSHKVELKLYTRSFKSKRGRGREDILRPIRNNSDERRSRPRFRERHFSSRNYRSDGKIECNRIDLGENYSQRRGFGKSDHKYVQGKGFPRNDKNNKDQYQRSKTRRHPHRNRHHEDIIPKSDSEDEKFDVKMEPENNTFNFKVILLIQPHIYPETRTYSELDSVNECMEKIIKMYEESLKKYHPNKRSIDYSALDLTHYIDQLEDLNLMVFQEKLQMYVPRNKDWIKEKIYVFLRSQLGILEKVSANSETLGGQKWAPVDHMF